MRFRTIVARFRRDARGQDLIEYLLLGTFVAIAISLGIEHLGNSMTDFYTAIFDEVGVQSASTGGTGDPGGDPGGGTGGGGNGGGNGGGGNGGGNGGGGNGGGNGGGGNGGGGRGN